VLVYAVIQLESEFHFHNLLVIISSALKDYTDYQDKTPILMEEEGIANNI